MDWFNQKEMTSLREGKREILCKGTTFSVNASRYVKGKLWTILVAYDSYFVAPMRIKLQVS